MKRRQQKQTHSSISRIQSIPGNDAAKDTAWSALVRGAIVKVWLADTGNWQVAITETLEYEAKEKLAC